MSLVTNIRNAFIDTGNLIKSVRMLVNGNAADLSALTTTAKSSLLAAINEVDAKTASAGAAIVDTGTSTTSVWSSSKTNSEILAKVAALVDSSPGALDTLNELAAALGDDPNFAATLTAALATKAADADVVKLSGNQTIAGVKTFSSAPVVPDATFAIAKTTGLQAALDAKVSAVDVGDTNANFVADLEAAML